MAIGEVSQSRSGSQQQGHNKGDTIPWVLNHYVEAESLCGAPNDFDGCRKVPTMS